ncbi:hypothetical protein ACXJJ3_20665 [Kribbella sp. WER1]
MRTLMSGRAWVSYAQIYVESGAEWADLDECFAGQRNGLCGAATPGTLWLITGMHTGEVGFTVELHDTMPAVEYDAEDVVEASYRPIEAAQLVSWSGTGAWALELEPGVDYRVRYSAWGMDAGHQGAPPMDGEPPVDRYLLQFWPAPPAPERVVKQTSGQAAYWHQAVRELPTPAELAEQKRERARQAEEQRLAERKAAWGGTLPTERLENVAYAQQLSALDRQLVDALAETDPQTLRSIARWAARRACEEAGYGGNQRVTAVLDRMDRGADWFETLDGPRGPVEPGIPMPTIHLVVDQAHGWFAGRDPIENTTTVVFPTFNEDPLQAATETVWMATTPFADAHQLLAELWQRFFRSPGL